MNDFLNPYIAGAPVVEPSMFFGRQDVFDWIEQNLSGRFVNHILVIHGQRRVGKTSVLKQIPNHLPSHFINVFFDLQGRTHTSLDRFQWWLAREICRAVSQARGGTIPVPEHELFAQDGEYMAATFLPEVFSKLGESILLLTFDEFDTLSEPEIQQSLTKPLIAYLRRLFDQPKLNFIFSIGSSGHKLENMQASYTEFFKTALYRKISFLKQEDCAHLITQPVEGVLIYEPEAVERIYTITSGHPYFTQLICHELFSLSQKTGRRTLTRQDLESVLEDVIERGTVNLKFVWDEASDLEKWVLSSLAHELQAQELNRQALGIQSRPVCTEAQLASALHNHHVRYSENDLNTALVHLREKDVLTQDNRFIVELLCIWLLKNRPLDRVREELLQVNPIANRYNEIGDEFHALGQPDKALESFQQALSTDPSNLRAQVSIANLHLEGRSYDQAVRGYEAALHIDDDDIAARSGLSTALMALGEMAVAARKFEEAEGYYQRILTINPDHPEVHLRLAALYDRQAEEALTAGDAELALRYYPLALEHAPEDSQLVARYAQAKEEHTRRLIDELLKQSQQAQEQQDWEAALDAVQRALQLAPNDPALLNRLATMKETSRLAKISSLRLHAQEMEQGERWEEAIHDWEACLQLHPEDEGTVRQSLEHARRGQKLAADYSQAQLAIKEGRYSQAISLLQGVIAVDATYKDAAMLLVNCLKARPEQMLKLPVRWLRWGIPTLFLILVIAGVATQWSRLSPLLAGIGQPKTPIATQAAGMTPPPTLTAGDVPHPTATAANQASPSFLELRNKMTGYNPANVQDDFSSSTLQEYWSTDQGAQEATLQDDTLRLNNEFLIGDGTLNYMNYILQVDLRFGGISRDENFVWGIRTTEFDYSENGTKYQLNIWPSTGDWKLWVMTDPYGQYSDIQQGNLGAIEAGRWYELGLVVQNETFWVYWEDQQIITQNNVSLFGTINCFGLNPSSAGEATLDIDNWRFWDLGTPAYMRNDWITSHPTTVEDDNFVEGEGWQSNPTENGIIQDGTVELFTNGGETSFSREDLAGSNVALEVTFTPRDLPDSASLVWFLAVDKAKEEFIAFEYYPVTGFWQIFEVEGQAWSPLASGWTQPTPQDANASIMVVLNGGRVSAFHEGIFLVYADSNRTGSGRINYISVRSNGDAYTRMHISKISFWNLDTVEWMADDWITARPETVLIDSFTGIEGLQFNPVENEKYEDGKAVLFTQAAETGMTRDDLQGKNIALEVSFVPQDMSDSGYLVWFLGQDSAKNRLEFSYSPKDGSWWIGKGETQQWEVLASGTAQPTPQGNAVTIMVVADPAQVRVFMNASYIASADINRSGAGTWNELVIREKENVFARDDIYLIRFWDLGSGGQTSGAGSVSLIETINKMTDGIPDFMDDFEGATLHEYWTNDQGAQEATLQDGALRLNNEYLIGKYTLNKMNYILQVDLRFGGLSGNEDFVYYLRTTSSPYGGDTNYQLTINPSNGYWSLEIITEFGGQYQEILRGNLEAIEAGRWYELGLVVQNETFWVYWEDQQIITQNNVSLFGTINGFGLDLSSAGEATLDIDNWRYWELDYPTWMRNDWITKSVPTVAEDNFTSGEGWQISGGGAYEAGKAVLFTTGGETGLTRDDIQGTNFAMEVNFRAVNMPESASLVLFLRKDTSTGESLEFEYLPTTGFWQIKWTENKDNLVLASGWTRPTPQDAIARIMVLVDGERVSAFYGDAFLGYAESSRSGTGAWNEVVIRSSEATYAEVDILKIGFWDLDTPESMSYERIYVREPSLVEDYFVQGEGWRFGPPENEKYEDGRAVLFTNGGDTYFSRDEFANTNIALEVTFIPVDTLVSPYLLWQLGKDDGDWLGFEYFPVDGKWRIFHQLNPQGEIQEETLASGFTQPTPEGNINTIMVVADVDQVSAFLNGVPIGSVNIDRSGAGTHNTLAIISGKSDYARVDIIKLVLWKLDQ